MATKVVPISVASQLPVTHLCAGVGSRKFLSTSTTHFEKLKRPAQSSSLTRIGQYFLRNDVYRNLRYAAKAHSKATALRVSDNFWRVQWRFCVSVTGAGFWKRLFNGLEYKRTENFLGGLYCAYCLIVIIWLFFFCSFRCNLTTFLVHSGVIWLFSSSFRCNSTLFSSLIQVEL